MQRKGKKVRKAVPYRQEGVAVTSRSFREYRLMFDLDEDTLAAGPILDVAAGASSFVAEAVSRGYDACAADPLYAVSPDELERRGLREIEASTAKLTAMKEQFDWSCYGSPARHEAERRDSLSRFVRHYAAERDIRYIPAALPRLPFADQSFHLVLNSHFLFLYGNHLDARFYPSALKELLRVCRPEGQIRIYPLVTLDWNPYPRLDELLSMIRSDRKVKTEICPTRLPFIPNSSFFLKIHKI